MPRISQKILSDVRGFVIHGAHTGRTLGYPTANLSTHYFRNHNVPKGVYAGWATIGNKTYMAAVVIGVDEKLEVHLIGFQSQIYGRWLRVKLVVRLRNLTRFTSRQALINQIARDVKGARRHLATSRAAK
ncbi:MAG: riboflavin kinase [Patescibacteria group bacterium]